MSSRERHVQASKYLARHLRHAPGAIGLVLEPGGWVEIDRLLAACASHGVVLTRSELEAIVQSSDKQRFAIDPGGTKIRANQGHSVDVDLGLAPADPPATLYHGTAARNADAIAAGGLSKMARHHVHLSLDRATAIRVGSRHGAPIVFVVDAAAMHRDGHTFHRADNGVWLVEAVPPRYLRRE
jgi:putative RNA 2'-phosphotransferase